MWQVHHRLMLSMRPIQEESKKEGEVPRRPDTVDEVAGQPSFSALN